MKQELLISSTQNPLVKHVVDLQAKSRSRREYRKFVVEGLNELRLCLGAGYVLENLLFCEENISWNQLQIALQYSVEENKIARVSAAVFEKMAYRKDVKNAIAIMAFKDTVLEDLRLTNLDVFLVAEGIEKPGNLGAILRSADAMGAGAVLVADPKCDLYNPNVIRGSVGCVFTLPVVVCNNEEALRFLEENGFGIFTTFMENSTAAWEVNFEARSAIVVGTESTGLTEFWKSSNHKNINIPMFGKVDSLNVSVAVSLLLYEASRQQRTRP